MTGKDMLYGVGFIDERFIAEADGVPVKKTAMWIRWYSLAACLCLIIGVFFLFRGIQSNSMVNPSEMAEGEALETPTNTDVMNDHETSMGIYDVEPFSYSADSAQINDNDSLNPLYGFSNSQQVRITSPDDAVSLAQNEVTITYDSISVAYDDQAKVWRISFTGNRQTQHVYLNSKGQTILCVLSE